MFLRRNGDIFIFKFFGMTKMKRNKSENQMKSKRNCRIDG